MAVTGRGLSIVRPIGPRRFGPRRVRALTTAGCLMNVLTPPTPKSRFVIKAKLSR